MKWPECLGVRHYRVARYNYFQVVKYSPKFSKSRKAWVYFASDTTFQGCRSFGERLNQLIKEAEDQTGLVCLSRYSLHNVTVKSAWAGREELLMSLFSALNREG